MNTQINLQRLLAEYLQSRECEAFDWRHNNCCHFAAQWMALAAGVDPMAGLPETMTAADARRLVRKLGGSLGAAWTHALGRESIAPALAQIGDIVLVPASSIAIDGGVGCAVGICAGRTLVVMDAAGALHHAPMWEALSAWRLRAEVPAAAEAA